jgi:uncharacterized YigZ family protein
LHTPALIFFFGRALFTPGYMPNFSYLTIKAPAEGVFKEKGSKFLAFAYPVDTEEEIEERIKSLKKKYYDARHHGYAFVLGPDKEKHRAFDDGEPSHSTGDPILGQLRSRNLTNVLVVVVRYFGGVKLGVGGLIAAYKTAADNALNNGVIIEKDVTRRIGLLYEYDATPAVMRLVKEFELSVLEQNFNEAGQMTAEIRLQLLDSFKEKVKLLQALGSSVTLSKDKIY